MLNNTLLWIGWNAKTDDSRSEPELDKVWRLGYGWALAVHVSLKFMWWYTQKPKLSFWSDHNRTMNYLSEFAKKKQNSLNINLAIISSLWLGIKMSLFWFTAITSHLWALCDDDMYNTILCTLQSSDKFAGIHSSLHNCVKTDPKFWLMDEVSWNKTEIFPSSSVFLS